MERIGEKLKRDENSITLTETAVGHETLGSTFEKAIQQGIENALTLISTRFEHAPNPLDNLAYHNTWHTEDVMRRARLILEVVTHNDEHLVRLGEFIAAYHDTVQAYDAVTSGGKTMRKRHTEKNEMASAEEALAYIETIDPMLLSPADKAVIEKAILVTIPGFVENKEERYATVVQPNLNEQSELLVRAIALADLGTAGMDGAPLFVREGAAIFREENMDIAQALLHPEMITEEQKQSYIQRMLAWSDMQPGFARGREKLLDKELRGLPEESQRKVAALFDKFYESVQGAQAKADMRHARIQSGEWGFEELAEDFGYSI